MHALQDLGTELVELPEERLAQVDLPEPLRDAIEEARRIKDFEGRRRQMQYIGKLMRNVDPAPIRAKLDSWTFVSREETQRFQLIEDWRERLLSDDAAIGEFAAAFPDADMARVKELVQDVKRERAAGRPPKSFRTLFRLVRDEIIRPR